MAKRRKLEAPSADELGRIEAEFRRETGAGLPRTGAPIAQVAADAAAALDLGDSDARVAQAKDAADAERLRKAEADGLVMLDIPLDDIEADSMVRDRSVLDKEALDELRQSISRSGQRLPIEVYALVDPEAGKPRFGLLSGYRRLKVMRDLHENSGWEFYSTIRAILRKPRAAQDRFAAMVEENEVRQSLSQYERGRIAVIAAQQGAFENTESAVSAMFPVASKAKRSKIRSFAMIFEELGDLMTFPENLKEKEGLRIAMALRDGAESRLREALATNQGVDPASEWALIEAVLDELDGAPRVGKRAGRPKVRVPPSGWAGRDTLRLSSGITLRKDSDAEGYLIHLSGKALTPDLMDSLMEEIRVLLERP